MTRKIVVFTGEVSYAVRKGIIAIDEAIGGLQWLILKQQPPRTLRRLLRGQWVNLRRNGWRWIPYQLADLWSRMSARQTPAARPGPGSEYSYEALLARPNVCIDEVGDLHALATLERVREFGPELGLSLAAPILRRALFSIPARGTVNLHKGKLPEFRGMPPAFWELWHDEKCVGCSVHSIDDGLDTGALIAESSVPRPPHASVRGLQLILDELGIELMAGAVDDLLEDRVMPRTQRAGFTRAHRKPTLAQEARLRRKLAPAIAIADRPRRFLKEAYAATVFGLHRAGLDRLLAPRITVLLFHRISDDVRDNLTVGIGQFERQMAFVARHCDPISIEEVLASASVRRSVRPLVAVTFDDGYLDNYLHAAPILRRHGVPAAFFVSTGVVDSERRFAHDVKRGNPPIPMMTWEQLRTMRRWGFTIGSHTVSHIDCAAEPESVVREELEQSRDALRSQLGIDEPIFAYPYGGKQHMTPERLELVREASYVGCLSAYGGTNVGSIERFNVLRRGIHHEFSDRSFKLECLGLT